MGGTGDDEGFSIALDASGNVYTTGFFRGTTDFDPGVGVFNMVAPVGGAAVFISKLDANGNFVWAKAMDGIGIDAGSSIAIDPAGSGDVYTTGYFGGTADFDPGVGTFNLSSAGGYDIFISKLDAAGNFMWAKNMGGSVDDYGKSIALDGSGNVYTTGFFRGTADFDPGVGVFNMMAPVGGIAAFISKLNANGNFVWAKALGGTTIAEGFSIALDPAGSGDVYTTGFFMGTVDFDPGAGTFNLTSAGSYEIFISKLDTAGNFVWAKAMSGTSGDVGYSIAIDPAGSGDVYTTGNFGGTVDFDPGAGTFNLTSGGVFISKLDAAGNFVWAKAMEGTQSSSIALDPAGSGDVYTTGYFWGGDFDPGAGTFILTSAGGPDIFISKLDAVGNFVWAKAMGGTGSDAGSSIALDPAGSGDVYTTGFFQDTADFDPDAGTFNLTSAGSWDIFIVKLGFGTGIAEGFGNEKFTIYPNPTTGKFTVSGAGEIQVFDLFGRLLLRSNKEQIDMSGFSKGLYFVKAGETTLKLIIQ